MSKTALALTPDTLPLLVEVGILVFPIAPGWGVAFLLIQMIMRIKHMGTQLWQHPLAWILSGLSLWLFLVTGIAPFPLESLLGIANLLPFFLFFLVFSPLFNSPQRQERLAWLLVLPSCVVSTLGLAELWLGLHTPPVIWQLFGWQLTGEGNPPGRFASTFLYANLGTAYLLVCLFLGLSLWLKGFAWQKLRHSRLFIYLSLTLVLDGVALFLTHSRSGWAIAFIGLLIYALYGGWWWLCGLATGFGLAVGGASFGQLPLQGVLRNIVPYFIWGRLSDEMFTGRSTESLRLSQWQFVLEMIGDRPLTGWGLRSFTPLYEAATTEWLGHPHNVYLMLMGEVGLPMAILLIGVVGWIFYGALMAWQRLENSREQWLLVGYLMAFGSLCLFNVLDVTMLDLRLNFFGWILLSALWGWGHQINHPRDQRQGDRPPK